VSKGRRQDRRSSPARRHNQQRSRSNPKARTDNSRRQPSRRRRTSFWQGPWPIVGTLGGIVVLIAAFVLISRLSSPGSQQKTSADSTVVSQVTHVSTSVIDAVGTGGATVPIKPVTGAALTGSGGKPEVLYVGAEWCPYCAAERWAMLVALSQFGTFGGLHFTTSSSTDVFPDTHTFSLHGITYSSSYVDFVPVETQDRNRNPLDSLTSEEQSIAQTYDPDNSIPFLDFGNRYTMIGQGVPPDPLQGLTWQQIGADLSNSNSPVTKAIVGNANYLTAAICKLPGATAAPICSDSTIKQISSLLPAS
jgi:thiol-disulfide isomerase/thioredoxin